MSFICFDTEDNSKELAAAIKRGDKVSMFDKQVTQIAAIAKSGKRFYWTHSGEDLTTKSAKNTKIEKDGIRSFLKWLTEQPERFVYALNTQYDLGNLFRNQLDDLDMTLVGGRLIKAVWGTKIFNDVFNLYQMSVANLGKSFGLEKLEFDATSKEYVFRDVEIIYRAVDFAWDFASDLGIATVPSTIGGLTIKVWKCLGGMNCHDTNPASKAAYYGGRVELFKHRNEGEHIAYTDVNSLYPSAMLGEFPTELKAWISDTLPAFGIVRAKVNVPKCKIAVLPYRARDGRILYPYGEFTGTWTIPEFKAALERGATAEVLECWGTNDGFRPYYTFVEHCWEKRFATKDKSENLFFKLLMNNLYGRLGTGGVIGRTVWQTFDNQDEGVVFGKKVLVNYQMPLSIETNWAHAAYVTAYGRLRLLHFIEAIGVDRMIYTDTDSTIFDCDARELSEIPFKCSARLGDMKLEGWGEACETYAPKMYRTTMAGKEDFKAKGVPKRLAQQFIETGRVDFDLPFKMREAIRFYDKGNSKALSVWRNVEKFRRGSYDKKERKGNRYLPCKVVEDC